MPTHFKVKGTCLPACLLARSLARLLACWLAWTLARLGGLPASRRGPAEGLSDIYCVGADALETCWYLYLAAPPSPSRFFFLCFPSIIQFYILLHNNNNNHLLNRRRLLSPPPPPAPSRPPQPAQPGTKAPTEHGSVQRAIAASLQQSLLCMYLQATLEPHNAPALRLDVRPCILQLRRSLYRCRQA